MSFCRCERPLALKSSSSKISDLSKGNCNLLPYKIHTFYDIDVYRHIEFRAVTCHCRLLLPHFLPICQYISSCYLLRPTPSPLPHGATSSIGPEPPHYRGFKITLRHTIFSRYPLDEWWAHRRDLYLTTHNTQKRQTSLFSAGFEPAILGGERPQTYALYRAANGIGSYLLKTSEKAAIVAMFWSLQVTLH